MTDRPELMVQRGWECEDCGERFEKPFLAEILDGHGIPLFLEKLPVCPYCGSENIDKRMIAAREAMKEDGDES